jgi:hypothetical protein
MRGGGGAGEGKGERGSSHTVSRRYGFYEKK